MKTVHKEETNIEVKKDWKVWKRIGIAFIGLILLIVASVWIGKNLFKIRQEVIFTINHPDMVKPVREIYEMSHQKVDRDIKNLILGK